MVLFKVTGPVLVHVGPRAPPPPSPSPQGWAGSTSGQARAVVRAARGWGGSAGLRCVHHLGTAQTRLAHCPATASKTRVAGRRRAAEAAPAAADSYHWQLQLHLATQSSLNNPPHYIHVRRPRERAPTLECRLMVPAGARRTPAKCVDSSRQALLAVVRAKGALRGAEQAAKYHGHSGRPCSCSRHL